MNKNEKHEKILEIRSDIKVLNKVLDLLNPEQIKDLQEKIRLLKENVLEEI